jgi:hypothetical protein
MTLLIRDPLIAKVFETVKIDATQAWLAAKSAPEREEAHAMVRAVVAVKLQMQIVADRGEYAEILRSRETGEGVEE